MKFALMLLAAYGLYAGIVFLVQRSILFPAGLAVPSRTDPEKISGLERHWLTTSSGETEAWFLSPFVEAPVEAGSRAPAMIIAHGNADNSSEAKTLRSLPPANPRSISAVTVGADIPGGSASWAEAGSRISGLSERM